MLSLRALLAPLAGAACLFTIFLGLDLAPAFDPRLAAPRTHFWIVSVTALLATALGVATGFVGVRARDARVVNLACGLVGLGGFFALHGLATPGVLVGPSRLPGVSAQISVLAFAGWLAVAVRARRGGEPSAATLRSRLAIWASIVATLVVAALLRPDLARWIPVDRAPVVWGTVALLLGLLVVAARRFLEGYRLARSSIHLALLHVTAWLAVVQAIMVLGELFHLSWWLYHGILLAAVVVLIAAVARQHRRGGVDRGLAALLTDDAEQRLDFGLRPEVRALVAATEAKDPYTAGHMRRVARNAVRLGQALGLDPESLRVLAQAGIVHDVGKLEVPDAILKKPGRLTDEEFAVIRRHPEAGARIASSLGMLRPDLAVIRHHHERWDGGGYPDGLSGEEIPLLARVLSVADVYDALTSERAYRRAWDRERARALLRTEAGRAFDPRCVAAWLEAVDPVSEVEAPAEPPGAQVDLRPVGA